VEKSEDVFKSSSLVSWRSRFAETVSLVSPQDGWSKRYITRHKLRKQRNAGMHKRPCSSSIASVHTPLTEELKTALSAITGNYQSYVGLKDIKSDVGSYAQEGYLAN
jgi:hypothetical protein